MGQVDYVSMSDKIRRIRCATKQCPGFVDIQLSAAVVVGGNWQFHCARCGYWVLVSAEGDIRGTSKEEFDLQRVSGRFGPTRVTRSPQGGV